jgi:DNA polymerase III, delta subunit
MVEGCVGPSELHLKKELTVLRKARFLRDPETCSSYRSPLSSKSFVASSSIIPNDHVKTNPTMKNSANVLSKGKNKRKVYLYNWRHQSVRSSESGFKSREQEDESMADESLSESKSETYHEYNVMGSSAGTPVRKTVRRVKRYTGPRKGATQLEMPISAEQSDDCRPGGYLSRTASPFFSGSCGSWSNPAKILKSIRREGSSLSCTPVSTSSYYAAGASVDGDDLLDRKGCGIFAKRSNFYSQSPSLSVTLRKKSSSLLCGSNNVYTNSNHSRKRSTSYNKRKHFKSNASPGLPLLADGGVHSPFDSESDEISTNFGELDLEAVSRLDGRRWSTSCKSYDGIDIGLKGKVGLDLEVTDQRSLSQKYQPRAFEEIVGQNIVTQSLSNAILRGKIAPAYLFQGPRGTGKTSTARVFAATLSCTGPMKEIKPCGACNECASIGKNLIEVDATNKSGISKVRHLLKNMPADVLSTRYTVFVIDECHMVSTKMWSAFMKLLDEPLSHVVFIFITIDPDNLPRAIMSRCQRYIFSKIKEADMVCRLRKISVQERLNVDLDALDLIALNSDGSLRDAETMLDQLSLLGKKITTSLVNDLVST